MLFRADPTFYPSPKLAGQAPPEKLAYVAALNANGGAHPDAIVVVDVDSQSQKFGKYRCAGQHAQRRRRAAISAGMRAALLFARMHPIIMFSAAI